MITKREYIHRISQTKKHTHTQTHKQLTVIAKQSHHTYLSLAVVFKETVFRMSLWSGRFLGITVPSAFTFFLAS